MNNKELMNKINISIFRLIEIRKTKTVLFIIFITLTMICFSLSQFLYSFIQRIDNIAYLNSSYYTISGKYYNEENTTDVTNLCNLYNDCTYNLFSSNTIQNYSFEDYSFSINIIGVENISYKMTLPSFDTFGATEKTELIVGRIPNENDKILNNHVILLYESVSKIFFGELDPLDRNIVIDKIEYKVIGILSDTLDIKRIINNINQKDNYLNTVKTLPFITNEINYNKIETIILFFNKPIGMKALNKVRNDLKESSINNIYLTSLCNQLEEQNKINTNSSIYKIILDIMTIVLSCTTAIFLYIIIREQYQEIAIRRSVGALMVEVISLVVNEVFVCCIISLLYAVPISIIIMNLISKIASNKLFTWIFPLNIKILLLPNIILIIILLIITLIITLSASNKKIITYLRDSKQ